MLIPCLLFLACLFFFPRVTLVLLGLALTADPNRMRHLTGRLM